MIAPALAPALAPAPIVITIRGNSPIAKKLARACSRRGTPTDLFALSLIEEMLNSLAGQPELLKSLSLRAAEKELACQLLGV